MRFLALLWILPLMAVLFGVLLTGAWLALAPVMGVEQSFHLVVAVGAFVSLWFGWACARRAMRRA